MFWKLQLCEHAGQPDSHLRLSDNLPLTNTSYHKISNKLGVHTELKLCWKNTEKRKKAKNTVSTLY